MHAKVELAGPPGDVGFVKAEGGVAGHIPLVSGGGLALHATAASGFLQPITFGGICGPPTVSDKFFVGGPMQLRGFLPTGIGPRAKTGGASAPGGDALGGDIFYTATVAASVPFPTISFLKDTNLRLFGFANVGSLTGMTSLSNVFQTTRASVGGGVCMGSAFGRMEATYAVPLRVGPRDARKAVQFGLGFSFG
jgi:outer membrane protein insertion porin family